MKMDMNAALSVISLGVQVLAARLLALVGICGAIGLSYWGMSLGTWQAATVACLYDLFVLVPVYLSGEGHVQKRSDE
jgi:hypothetical protein